MTSPTIKKPRSAVEERCERRRQEILEAGARFFARNGYSEADLQVLADELSVGKGTIYRYFPSKQDLFLQAVDQGMRLLKQHIDAAISDTVDPMDRIGKAIHAYLEFFATNPHYVELVIQERAQFRDRKKPTYFEHRDANRDRWRTLYQELIAAGRVRNLPVLRIMDTISDLVYGTMFTNYFNGPRKPFAEQAQDILDIVFYGILTRAEQDRRQTTEPT